MVNITIENIFYIFYDWNLMIGADSNSMKLSILIVINASWKNIFLMVNINFFLDCALYKASCSLFRNIYIFRVSGKHVDISGFSTRSLQTNTREAYMAKCSWILSVNLRWFGCLWNEEFQSSKVNFHSIISYEGWQGCRCKEQLQYTISFYLSIYVSSYKMYASLDNAFINKPLSYLFCV